MQAANISEESIYNEARYSLSKLKNSCRDILGTSRVTPPIEVVQQFLDFLGVDILPDAFSVEIETESLTLCTSAPLVMVLAELSTDCGDDEISLVRKQVLRTRCTFIASLPERLANIICELRAVGKDVDCDWGVLPDRICQALCCFLFAICTASSDQEPTIPNEGKTYQLKRSSALAVCDFMIQAVLARGYISMLFRHFLISLRSAANISTMSNLTFPFVLTSIYNCAFTSRGKSELSEATSTPKRYRATVYWTEWVSWLLEASASEPNTKKCLISTLLLMREGQDNAVMAGKSSHVGQALEVEIFATSAFYLPTRRDVLRVIFREVLPTISFRGDGDKPGHIQNFELTLFAEVFRVWGDRNFAESAPIRLNTTLSNSVMYILLHVKENGIFCERSHFPSALLQPLLDGISLRLESVRSEETRNEGITVAAAFALFFSSEDDTLNGVSDLELFPEALSKWMRHEPNHALMPGLSREGITERTHRVAGEDHMKFFRHSAENDEYPLDPDAEFTFFCAGDTSKSNVLVSSGTDSALFKHIPIANNEELTSFGKTSHEADSLDGIDVLVTLRESYNAVMGIGRSTSAQLYEVQQETESGLRGLKSSLQVLKGKLGRWNERVIDGNVLRTRSTLGEELHVMLPSLLPALMSITIHAPEPRHKELVELRLSVLIDIIIVSPEVALDQLSKMIYSSGFGIFQRVEMARAIGEAAKFLSHVKIRVEYEGKLKQCNDTQFRDPQKRIYPPIPNESKSITSTVFTEGRNTRRWGNSTRRRACQEENVYTSYLSEVAPLFISALLQKADDDYFSFFRDKDPYAPAEILRTISTVVQRIAAVRHVAPSLCENIVPFILAVLTRHPLSVIRKQAWILIGEVMRCWCGAGPLVLDDCSSTTCREGFGGSSSHLFSEQWVNVQQALEAIFDRSRNDFLCAEVALLVVVDLRDLLVARADFEEMNKRVVSARLISAVE